MKRIISIVLSLIMIAGLLATVSFTASADETPAPSAPPTVTDAKGNSKLNLVYCVEQFANGSDYSDIIRPVMFDGDRGSNTTGNERVVNVKWDAAGTKAKATCTDYGNGSPTGHNAGSNNTPAKNNKNVKIGGTNYKYYMSASVVGGATLTGLCVYFQGYKVAIFDHAFDILYSKDDGATWTKFIEVTDPFNPEAKYHLENYDAEAAYGATYENTKIVDPAYFYVDFSDTPLTGVTNIAYACKIPRCNNTYYVTRFTEFEVYGTLPTNYTPNGRHQDRSRIPRHEPLRRLLPRQRPHYQHHQPLLLRKA